MITKLFFTTLLALLVLYSWHQRPRVPTVSTLSLLAAFMGIYFVWFQSHAQALADLIGVSRGVDLIIYIWLGVSLLVMVNLHLKLREQSEVLTTLARKIALANPLLPGSADTESHELKR